MELVAQEFITREIGTGQIDVEKGNTLRDLTCPSFSPVAIAVPVLTSNLPLIFKDWILGSIPVLTIVWFIAFYFVNLKGTLHDIVAKDLGKVPETGIDVTVSNPEEKSDLAKNNLPDAGG